jgi:hypothetical protein
MSVRGMTIKGTVSRHFRLQVVNLKSMALQLIFINLIYLYHEGSEQYHKKLEPSSFRFRITPCYGAVIA